MEMLDQNSIQLIIDVHHNYIIPLSSLVAQQIEDPDIIGQIEDAWFNFIDTGQVWALLIGTFFGYSFKGFIG